MELYFHDIFPQRFVISNTWGNPCVPSKQESPAAQTKLHIECFWAFKTGREWYSDPQEAFPCPRCDLVIFWSSDVIEDVTLNWWDSWKVWSPFTGQQLERLLILILQHLSQGQAWMGHAIGSFFKSISSTDFIVSLIHFLYYDASNKVIFKALIE